MIVVSSSVYLLIYSYLNSHVIKKTRCNPMSIHFRQFGIEYEDNMLEISAVSIAVVNNNNL